MAGALRLKHPHTQYQGLTRFFEHRTYCTAKQKEMNADIFPTGRVVLHKMQDSKLPWQQVPQKLAWKHNNKSTRVTMNPHTGDQ